MENFKGKLRVFKEIVVSRKKQISIVAIILVTVAIVTTLIYNNVRQAQLLANNPEIAKSKTYDQVQNGDEIVDKTNGHVEFDAFFLRDLNGDGNAESIRGTSREIGQDDTLYMELNVLTNGSLEDGVITIDSDNFYLQTSIVKDNEVKSNYISSNTKRIELNTIRTGTQKLITGVVRSGDYSSDSRKSAATGNNINNYSKINSVTLTGTYVTDEGTRTEISKTVNFNVDWHGSVKAEISANSIEQSLDISDGVTTSDDSVKINFTVDTKETQNQLILKDVVFKATIPTFNGYSPTDVKVDGRNLEVNYDEASRILTVTRNAVVSSDGTVTSLVQDRISSGSKENEWDIEVTYPIEAYNNVNNALTYKVPVEVYYTGYNNTSSEFTNPYKSNVAKGTIVLNYIVPEGSKAIFEVTVGKSSSVPTSRYFVSKEKPLKIYNGVSTREYEDQYIVRWRGSTGSDGTGSMIMKERKNGASLVADTFIRTNSSEVSMDSLLTNVGIYFSNAGSVLGQDGWINVYNDETNELLYTFTAENWNNYDSENPYTYSTPVKHIRVETSNVNENSTIYVYNVKEIDDTKLINTYSRSEFDNLSYIRSNLVGYLNGSEINTDTETAVYEEPRTEVSLGVGNSMISTQVTERNLINITASSDKNSNLSGWTNGVFLVKIPSAIIDLQINYVESSNSEVEIANYELYEENGEKFIKIITTSDDAGRFAIAVDVNMTADPRKISESGELELYAYNESCNNFTTSTADIYDIDGDRNTSEQVGNAKVEMNFASPNSLLTSQTASNFDTKGTEIVAPQVAILDKAERDATISFFVTNNYENTVSDLQILGKIPSKGNNYTLDGGSLGSTFDTKLKGGITIPSGLRSYAKVYYSTNVNPTKDLSDSNNNWVNGNSVSNWSEIKSYLIDLSGYTMQKGASYEFSYNITIPGGLNYNDVSYSHHAVYFNLDTVEGKYATSTEPNKLGFMIAKQYNLQIQKYQKDVDKLVSGATYIALEQGQEDGKTGITDSNGIATIKGLYAEKTYVIKEIKSPSEYEVNEDEIIITTKVGDNGEITAEKVSGTTKQDITVTKENEDTYRVGLVVEDEVKANLAVTKIDKENSNKLSNILFKITGYGLSNGGKEVVTNSDGTFELSGLSINQEYTLQEMSADGYYLASVKFKIVKESGNYSVQILDGDVTETNVTVENDIPRANITIPNEKIPTYTLEITKVKENDVEENGLFGARYSITSVDTGETKYYTTDNDGKITINGLYNYVSGKYITGEYVLKELRAPEGFAISGEEIRFKVELKNGTQNVIITNEDQLASVKEHSVSGTTVNLKLQDSPTFKITKIDKDTGLPLANAKFMIQKVDSSKKVLGYAKDIDGNYVGERDSSGRYIISTDESGEITTPLQGGMYKITEVEAPEGYELPETEEERVHYFTIEGFEDLRINSIEDLVDFANSSDTYSGKIVLLARDLDFNDDNSYDNPNDTSYGDYNGDGTTQGIKAELTNTNGTGFKFKYSFNGTFLGDDHVIKNVYINSTDTRTGFFRSTSSAAINNLGITGEMNVNYSSSSSVYTGGIVGYAYSTTITNCYSEINVVANVTGTTIYAGGVVGYGYSNSSIKTSFNKGDINATSDKSVYIGGISYSNSGLEILGCWNEGDIVAKANEVVRVGGIASNIQSDLEKCYNIGNITGIGKGIDENFNTYVGGIGGLLYESVKISNCYNEGTIKEEILEGGTGAGTVGGLIGYGKGIIENCYNIGDVDAIGNGLDSIATGGISGYLYGEGKIVKCYNLGNISSDNTNNSVYVGGIVGRSFSNNSSNTISEVYNTGTIYGKSDWNTDEYISAMIGGISGLISETDVYNAYNTGNVTGRAIKIIEAGGIVGDNYSGTCHIYNTYNQGNVDAFSYEEYEGNAGGIVGSNPHTVDSYIGNCYNTGIINSSYFYGAGGIIGIDNNGTVENTYFMSGTANEGFGSGSSNGKEVKSSTEMQSSSFVNLLNSNRANISSDVELLEWVAGNPYPTLNIDVNVDTSIEGGEDETISTVTEIEIENELEKYDITTEIGLNSDGLRTGGTITGTPISGTNNRFVETVRHGDNAQNSITITPNSGYVIKEVTLNGQKFDYTVASDGTVTLPKLENVTKDYHYLVVFDNTIGQVIVHHYEKGTTNNLAEDDILTGTIGENYTTSPNLDIPRYELEKDSNGEYILPTNASGTYQKNTQEVIYYYVKKQIPLTVHYYIEGTEMPVELTDGSLAQDVENFGTEGEEYTTTEVENVSEKYELVEVPNNATGTYEYEEVEVTYYYRIKTFDITTKVEPHKETDEFGEEVDVQGGTISGEGETPYEEVEYGEDNTKDIIAMPDEGYEVSKITINGEEVEFTEEKNGSVILNKITDITEDKEVVVTFDRKETTVLVHHYIEETEEKVPSNIEGQVVEDEIKQGKVGDIYATREAENVAPNYEFVSTEGQTSGEMTEDEIVVTYYYKIKDPSIEVPEITKESSVEKVINEGQAIDYTINYTATVDTYIGDATVTIVDYLPYEIDESLSDVAGGSYDATSKTITWTEQIGDINTFVNDELYNVDITKEISLVYKDVDITSDIISNRVTGIINLETPEKEDTVETTKDIPTDYLVDVPVEKVWDDLENSSHRPVSVTVSLTADGENVPEKTAVLNDENEWKTTFEDLPKYTETGAEIQYSVVESETNPGDLEYYDDAVIENVDGTVRVTNSYKDMNSNIESSIDKSGTKEITSSTEEVSYTINYNATVDEYIGEGRVTIVDYLPYAIDEGKSDIAGGTYNSDAHTITWVEELGHVNTYEEGPKEVKIAKNIKVVLSGLDASANSMVNRVTGNIHLDGTGTEDTQEDTEETNININGTVVAKYLEEGTDKVLAPEEEQSGKVGTSYSTVQKDITGYDFVKVEGNETGTITEGTTEVIYYYRLKDPIITSEVTKESSVEKITSESQNVDYTINYKTTIKDYKGDATVTIVDTLPFEIDETKPYELAGGEYNKENKTITWVEDITGIDTYTNRDKVIEITKEINFSYGNIDVTQENVANTVRGTVNLETPEKEDTTETTEEIPTEYTVNIITNKVWNDNEEQSARRPESITLVVKNGDEEVQSKTVTKDDLVEGTTNQWSVEFTGLDKYDANGNEIQYTLEERETKAQDLHFYEAEENNVAVEDNQATIRNNFVRPEDTTQVTVTKSWNDSDNVNARRPGSIMLKVTGNGQEYRKVVTEDDNWSYTFTDLPKYDDNGKEIVYTASEYEANSGDLKFYTSDENSITGDMTSGYTITNTFTVPDEKIELTVNKVWQDNSTQSSRRPDVVTINVKGEDGSIVATYDLDVAGGETSHTFTDLPKYNSENGKEINYTVEEAEKNPGGLHFYTEVVGNVENTSENSKEVTITNTFTKPEDTTDVTVTKVWDDNNDEAGKRPSSIKLLLKNGSETVREQEVSGDTSTWTYTFEDVAMYNDNGQEIVYSADEAEVNSGDLQFYNKSVSGLTVTNEFTQDTTTVDVPVSKIWVDNDEQSSRRPTSVRIILKANEIKVREYDLTGTGDTWNYTFEDLSKYDSYNNIINYTVEEAEVNSGDLKFYSSSVDGTTITNTFTRPTDVISIEVTKNWEDQENVYNKRPISVRINVNNGADVVQTAIVTKDDNWKHTFTNLAKYDENGQEILYTVSEEEVMENDLYYYTGTSSLVENKAGETDVKEAVITNEMTKIPSKVIVKYVDKATGEEISGQKEKEGIIGDPFDVTEDVKEIPGYTLVEEPEEKTGTYTAETQEKTYYYAKNTRVIVKYLEKDDTPEDDSDNKVLSGEIVLGGYEGKSYTTNSKAIDGYTLVETKGNLNGTMTREEQVVVYYYAKDTKVIVKYLEKDNTPNDISDNKVLLPEKTIEGYVGKDYTTTGETVPNYTLVEKTTNFEGTMTEGTIIVVYYYAKNTSVVVKYLEQDNTPDNNADNKVLSDEIVISGYEGKDYETEQKTINNYTFVEDTGNTSGKMEENQIEVIYYYAQNTKAKVQHIDRETGRVLKEETENGKVGDLFETHPEDFEGYVLVQEPEEPDIIMDKTGEQVVKYYYAHVSAGVIEKHIDVITGELLASDSHEGNEGDPYDIPSRTFDGYDLVEDKLPDNSSGTMSRDEVIEVKYYYIKKATVVVKYVDETTGEEIAKEERIEGHENDEYSTEAKDIEDYNLTKTPDNSSGTMTIVKNEDGTYDTEIEVIYYYKKAAGGVIENHIDVDTNKKLATEEHSGNVGDEYDIPSRTFEDYDLVIDMLPDNSSGVMTEQEIVVNYYYKKKAKVVVEYIDKQTGEKLDEEEINGHLGDEYTTEEKTFDGYDLIEKPSNGSGEMTEDEVVVKYYYARKAEVEVKYLEKGTDYEVAEGETISGHVGDNYETEQKDVPYYKFVEKTDNWEGKMTKDKITVIYYYEKEIFNLGVDKWVESVNVNGISSPAQSISSSDEIYKVDIHRSKADTADIKVTYKIRITNKGELEGTVGKVTDIIPSGMSFYQEDNDIYWDNNNGVLTTDDLKDEVIGAGDYKEIEVTLRVNVGSENFGQKDNMVILTDLSNPAGYEDIDKEDNNDTSSMILTIATGLDRNDRIVIIGIVQIVLAISIGLLLSYKKKEKKTKE